MLRFSNDLACGVKAIARQLLTATHVTTSRSFRVSLQLTAAECEFLACRRTRPIYSAGKFIHHCLFGYLEN